MTTICCSGSGTQYDNNGTDNAVVDSQQITKTTHFPRQATPVNQTPAKGSL